MSRSSLYIAVLLVLTGNLAAGAESPAIRWGFSSEEASPLQPQGGVHRDVPGPRPPEYPDFEPGNTAVRFDGKGSRFTFADPGPESPFDFTNGDEITLEAWVQLETFDEGENVYVISKGRTGDSKFKTDNQNWALRLQENSGRACISFLFATPRKAKGSPNSHWHRWTSNNGFAPGKDWHHVAVTYQFGKPDSIVAVIDGQIVPGTWDMGGATTSAPVVDDDAIWIASSRGGAASNSFRGALDEIAIHRQAVKVDELKARYRGPARDDLSVPQPEAFPENLGEPPHNAVQVTLHEGMPGHDRWIKKGQTWPDEALRWQTDAFLMNRLPSRFDDWGIRDAWKGPVLVRMAADVKLSPGPHRFLLRVRGATRLWMDGELVARGEPAQSGPNGEEPMTPVAPPPLPKHRVAEHRQQEIFFDAVVGPEGQCRVVLETLVGGAKFHTDPGETCLAVLSDDGSSYLLLQPGNLGLLPIPLTDAAMTATLARHEQALRDFDDENRRTAAASQDDYWNRRHAAAREWAKEHPAPTVPNGTAHPVDAFLQQKLIAAQATATKSPAVEEDAFHKDVLPILRQECFRCHGNKEKGGLRLTSREGLLHGGDSGFPAVEPGNPADSELIRRIRSTDPAERMPPGEVGLNAKQTEILEAWVKSGAEWPALPISPEELTPAPVISDEAFLRRVTLDTIGVPLDADEAREFLASHDPEKRNKLIDRLLDDERWADHWMGYWQDVLAENPTLINASLNTTGPFRWFLHDALRENRPLDRMVTELVMLRGHAGMGGSAGFGIAGDNDSPLASKGQILVGAFLGIDLQCARCHDSPYHSTKQGDLFALAAMLQRKPMTIPSGSRVPAAFFEEKKRASLIEVSLKPDETVPPVWPFADITGCPDDEAVQQWLRSAKDSRERLAVLLTSPSNTRFAEVFVNRLWRRFLGAGIVEPPHDWEGQTPSHPELLTWLAREFVHSGYDVKAVSRLILTSQAYQREATGRNREAEPAQRLFAAPDRRRLTAEQILDSLHTAAGQSMDVEELTFDPDARRPTGTRINLGIPTRAWMFANLANERDRPSLNFPKARAITDILDAFGWSGARQSPRTDREVDPNVLQPGILANGPVTQWLTRATPESGLAEIAVEANSPDELVDTLYLRYFNRFPTLEERSPLVQLLADGFEQRLLPANEVQPLIPPPRLPQVTWTNHLQSEANSIIIEMEERASCGPSADPRFHQEWQQAYQDAVWSIVNLPEFIWIP